MQDITLRKKNGETFTGSPSECAKILLQDAIHKALHSDGLQQQWHFWSVQEFCEKTGVDYWTLLKDHKIDPRKVGYFN